MIRHARPPTLTTDAACRIAVGIVRHELPEGQHYTLALDAMAEAERLTTTPRATWPVPTNEWEGHVVAVATVIRRLEGALRMARPRAVEIVGLTLRMLVVK